MKVQWGTELGIRIVKASRTLWRLLIRLCERGVFLLFPEVSVSQLRVFPLVVRTKFLLSVSLLDGTAVQLGDLQLKFGLPVFSCLLSLPSLSLSLSTSTLGLDTSTLGLDPNTFGLDPNTFSLGSCSLSSPLRLSLGLSSFGLQFRLLLPDPGTLQ